MNAKTTIIEKCCKRWERNENKLYKNINKNANWKWKGERPEGKKWNKTTTKNIINRFNKIGWLRFHMGHDNKCNTLEIHLGVFRYLKTHYRVIVVGWFCLSFLSYSDCFFLLLISICNIFIVYINSGCCCCYFPFHQSMLLTRT